MDWDKIAENPIAQLIFGLFTAAGAWRYWRNTSSSDAKERADASGQIGALAAWQQMAEAERAARLKAEERADRLSVERNEALAQLWDMRAQLKLLQDTITAQTQELAAMREQVRLMKEQLDGRP